MLFIKIVSYSYFVGLISVLNLNYKNNRNFTADFRLFDNMTSDDIKI